MSPLKKILGVLVLGTAFFVGIAILMGKIIIPQNWFSLRALQLTFAAVLSVLSFLYASADRTKLGVNQLKSLATRSKIVSVLFLATFIWSVVSTPVTPVTVSMTGVAKVSDITETQKGVQSVDEHLSQAQVVLSSFRSEQGNKADSLANQLIDLRTTIMDLDSDNQVRHSALSKNVLDVSRNLTQLAAQVKELQNKKEAVAAAKDSPSMGFSWRLFFMWFFGVVLFISFGLSFFFKDYTTISVDTRRYGIPIIAASIVALLYFSPAIGDTYDSVMHSSSKKDTAASKKESSTATPVQQKEEKKEVQEPVVSKDNEKQEPVDPPVADTSNTVATPPKKDAVGRSQTARKKTFVYKPPF